MLHDTQTSHKNDNTYIYHLSDDINHDSVMTTEILKTIIRDYPETIETGKLVLHSDNCSTQYKSRFVFKALLVLAKKYGITIDFFYSEAGHGRGLIDAMAWFGCKRPMRKEIVTNDTWFANAPEIYSFLTEHFKDDTSKEYHLIDQRVTASERSKGREERFIKGCNYEHVISFCANEWYKKWCTVKDCMDESKTIDEDEDGMRFRINLLSLRLVPLLQSKQNLVIQNYSLS